jgi:hypothetical protein
MIDRREERDVIRYAQQESQRAAKPFKRSVKISEWFSGLPLFRRTIAQTAVFRSLKGEGAKDTHLSLAPSKASPIPRPSRGSITLTCGASCHAVRKPCDEVHKHRCP